MFGAAKSRIPNLGRMKPYSPSEKLVVRDSLEDEISDDIEDDVFIRDGRTCKTAEEKGQKRPLMAPRRKQNKIDKTPIMKKRKKCWRCCEPFCYGLAAITIIIALILLAAFLLSIFPLPVQKIKVWFHNEKVYSENRFNLFMNSNNNNNKNMEANTQDNKNVETIPCNLITASKVWHKVITKLNSETPVRKMDVNADGVADVIFGYGIDETQPDDQQIPLCTAIKSGLTNKCEGGLIALNGVTGEILWQRWTAFTIFSIICALDINEDSRQDCVASGRGGLVAAINGRTGEVIWELKDYSELETISELIIDLYTISLVSDLDRDGIPDVIAVHVEEELNSRGGHIKLISGRTGITIRTIPTPSREEVFVPVQFLTQKDGTELLLISTGGQSSAGGVYILRLHTMMEYQNEKDFASIYQNKGSGFMVPAVLTDITGDSVEDIVVSSFNSTIFAFDGATREKLWMYNFLTSESVSSIVPGRFDSDNVTDFMVKYNTGPGFPIYYYSQTMIINGATGKPFLDVIIDSGGPNSLLAGLSMRQTFGGDFFLHWQIECRGKPGAKDAYQFIPDSDIIQQSRADTCRLRYNTSTIIKLYALNRHMEPPGALIFSTDELTLKLNTTLERGLDLSIIAPLKHPKMKLANRQSAQKASNAQPQPEAEQQVKVNKEPKIVINKKMDENDVIIDRKNTPEELPVNNFGRITDNDNTNVIRKNYPKYGRRKGQYAKGNQNLAAPQDNDDGKPYIYLPYQQGGEPDGQYNQKNPYQMRNFPNFPNQAQRPNPSDEYEDDFYNENNQIPRFPMQRQSYPSENRGIRSKNEASETTITSEIDTTSKPKVMDKKISAERAQTLWDLEFEKETKEALEDPQNFNYGQDSGKRSINEEMQQEILPTISSTGTLLKSFNTTTNTTSVDYVFILNVRESEDFPPLYLQEDYDCVQEKMQGYKSYLSDELEKKFLIQCLKNRLPNFKSKSHPKFETQIVITRLTLTCGCEDKMEKQVCSKLSAMDQQKWTEYMGVYGNGIYPN